jgi:hypothetical protein
MQTTAAREAAGSPRAGSFCIGALQGAGGAEIQRLLAAFATRRIGDGLRVAGMIEEPEPSMADACGSLVLRDVASGKQFPISQDLGAGSTACRLDTDGLAAACQAVLQAIESGADVVVLSKFGKTEAEGGGLVDAFRAAAEAGVPCVTGVPPANAAAFLNYAGGFSQWIEASDAALERWWSSQS